MYTQSADIAKNFARYSDGLKWNWIFHGVLSCLLQYRKQTLNILFILRHKNGNLINIWHSFLFCRVVFCFRCAVLYLIGRDSISFICFVYLPTARPPLHEIAQSLWIVLAFCVTVREWCICDDPLSLHCKKKNLNYINIYMFVYVTTQRNKIHRMAIKHPSPVFLSYLLTITKGNWKEKSTDISSSYFIHCIVSTWYIMVSE